MIVRQQQPTSLSLEKGKEKLVAILATDELGPKAKSEEEKGATLVHSWKKAAFWSSYGGIS